jgi:C-terminal processing protease CtpA/Prc
LHGGESFEVESPDGNRRTVDVPAGALPSTLAGALWCADPLGRSTHVPAESYVRPDGVGVIRVPGFVDPEQTFPTSGSVEDFEAYREAFQAKIQAAFEAVKDARALVWDIRGNGGGLTLVGLAIASGFPGASDGEISYCRARLPRSDPPDFDLFRYARYALTPGGPFAYEGKVAVLTDGLNYSAADYFPLAVKTKTSALLVGSGTAGGFGATSDSRRFEGPPAFSVSVDINRCSLSADDAPLEGMSVEPHVVVDYDPRDLARGADTILERAVAEIDR